MRRHHDRLYGLCRRLTGNDADAADACQEALIAIVRGLPRYAGRSSFGTWAYRVATNAALDELRRRRRRPEPSPVEETNVGSAGLRGPNAMADAGLRGPNAMAGLHPESVAGRLDIDAALATLTPEFRAPVVLRDLCALSYEEIADVLGIPIGTVRSRIARGRAALVPLLTGNRGAGGRRQTGER